jgi:Tfp pilus assembly protein PilF
MGLTKEFKGGCVPPSEDEAEARKLFERAREHRQAGNSDEAIELYSKLIEGRFAVPDAYNDLAILLFSMKRLPAAIACLRRALIYAPQAAIFHSNLGRMLAAENAFDEAMAEYGRALALDPMRPKSHHNLGLLYYRLGNFRAAIECFDRALALDPACRTVLLDRAFALLAAGDWVRGFAGYDERFDLDDPATVPDRQLRSVRRLPLPLWQGEEIGGRTLYVYAEQGLGDTLQFVRFLPLAARRGARIVFDCQPELLRLMRDFPGITELREEGGPLPVADFQLPLMSLPHRLGITLETLPRTPYLAPPPMDDPPQLIRPPGTRLAAGIVWAGRPQNAADQDRSMTLQHFLGLCDLPGLALYSLQKGARASDIGSQGVQALVQDLGSKDRDLADTAHLVMQLDLVISIDSAVAHLAGALGRPGFVLAPFTPDWRWAGAGAESTWYPSLRLFRQQAPSDWHGVIRRVRDALAQSIALPA